MEERQAESVVVGGRRKAVESWGGLVGLNGFPERALPDRKFPRVDRRVGKPGEQRSVDSPCLLTGFPSDLWGQQGAYDLPYKRRGTHPSQWLSSPGNAVITDPDTIVTPIVRSDQTVQAVWLLVLTVVVMPSADPGGGWAKRKH